MDGGGSDRGEEPVGTGGGARQQAPSRRATVPAARLGGWVDRFTAGHGGAPDLCRDNHGHPLLVAPDGTTAVCELVVDDPAAYDDVAGLVEWALRPHPYALLLVRRGGWAVALAEGVRVGASRVGTRYVQGRTKAGGWSQQRYARRRARQADTVVDAAVSAAAELFGARHSVQPSDRPSSRPSDRPSGQRLLVTGGDRLLLRDTLAGLERTGARLTVAGRRLDVPDPRRRVLDDAAVAACAVRVAVFDGPGTAGRRPSGQ